MSWRTELFLFFVLFCATFGILLPRLCRSWRYSYYYQPREEKPVERKLGDFRIGSDEQPLDLPQILPVTEEHFFLLITVVTVERPGRYLSRVIGKLHQLIGKDSSYQVLICNVDPEVHNEAVSLSRRYRYIRRVDRYPRQYWDRREDAHAESENIYEKEKNDYAFCLNISRSMFSSDYILVLEDDALPSDDLFPVTRHLLQNRLAKHSDFFYIKLYHPERLQGYLQPEPWRIAEWLALSVSLGFVLTLLCSVFSCRHRHQHNRRKYISIKWIFLFCWTLYFMGVTETIGRTHLLELRRLSPHLYNVLAATECCTPAM